MKCKEKTAEGKKCIYEGVLFGYCIRHFKLKQDIELKEKKGILQNIIKNKKIL